MASAVFSFDHLVRVQQTSKASHLRFVYAKIQTRPIRKNKLYNKTCAIQRGSEDLRKDEDRYRSSISNRCGGKNPFYMARGLGRAIGMFQAVSAHNFTIHSHSHSHGNSSSKSDEILEVSRNVTVIEFSRTIIEQATVDTDLIEMALNSSLGDIGDKPTLFCQVAQLKNVYYYYGVIGNQYNYGITSLGSCLYHCVVNNHERRAHQGDDGDENDCKAVNYFSYHKACQLLNSGIESLETADRRTYGQMNGVVHAYIQSCYGEDRPERPPPCATVLRVLIGPDGETTSAPKRTTRPPWHTIPPVAPATNGCGVSAYQPSVSDKQRIIRGQEAKAHSWPWVVLFNLNFGQQRSFCGGTLLRIREDVEESDVVLTAAHCVTRPETQ